MSAVHLLSHPSCTHSEQGVQKALDLVERTQGSTTQSSSSVKGRVDFVQVKDWGSGVPKDLGNLELAAPAQRHEKDTPFSVFLVRYMEGLEAEGSLAVARPTGAQPLPPFSRWLFSEPHYIQYLEDMLCVHSALEDSLASALSTSTQAENTTEKENASVVFEKCHLLGMKQELARSTYIAQDLASMRTSSSSSLPVETTPSSPSVPTPNAAAYAQSMRQLAVQRHRSESEKESVELVLKLTAHVYVNMLALLTTGNRVGAAAAEKLDLFRRGAVNTFKTYPLLVKEADDKSPVALFYSAVDNLGRAMSLEEQEMFLKEVPSALRRTAVLLESLAKDS